MAGFPPIAGIHRLGQQSVNPMASALRIRDRGEEQRAFVIRALVLFGITVFLALVLVLRMAHLQIWQHDVYRTRSDENRIALQPIAPARGIIYDRNGIPLAENRMAFSLGLVREHIGDLDQFIAELSEVVALDIRDIDRFKERLARRHRPFEAVPIKLSLTDEEMAALAVNRHRFVGAELEARSARHYPLGNLLAHAVGSVRRISEADLEHLDPVRYSATRYVGRRGVERFYESSLHGDIGTRRVEMDAHGRIRRVLDTNPPRAGRNIRLHLDVRLQAAAAAALSTSRGAIVALDPRSGGILAMVSKPSYDPNQFVAGIDGEQYRAWLNSRDKPLFNRAINGQYPPGSTFKLVVALAALANGVVDWEEEILDRGSFRLPGGRRLYRDWSWRKNNAGGQGIVRLNRAIYRSSNVFFYHMGTRLPIDQLAGFARRMGYGQVTSLDVAGASAGLVPDPVWKRGAKGEPWYPGDNLNLSIGQGDLLVTPLQVATAVAVIANRGRWVRPRMLLSSDGPLTEVDPPPPMPDVASPGPGDWENLVDAMEEVVHRGNMGFRQNGTAWAYIGRGIGYRMAGKSGTVQVTEIPQGEEYDESLLDEYTRKHAWFAAFAPVDNPAIVVSVLVENGGGGSSVAAPLVRQVMDAYLLPQLAAQ